MTKLESPEADVLFEISWEVCNRVGGIYTVLRTKVNQMMKHYDGKYFVIGPYFPGKLKGEFQEHAHPSECEHACEQLKDMGIVIHYGKWLVGDRPTALLIDFQPLFSRINEIKKELWDEYQIDSLDSPYEFNEPVLFGWAAGMVIEKFSRVYPENKTVVQAHEWIAGASILYLRKHCPDTPTVFTTHATVLGRALANRGVDIYAKNDDKLTLESMELDKKAYEIEVASKHQMEKACAHAASVFTTVSDITAIEAEQILKRRPCMVLPNGIEINKFPSSDECPIRHKDFKERILMFLTSYFFPYYWIDLDNTHIFYTAARYEFHDKGIDVFIDALGRLNQKLKKDRSKENVVAFIWVPANIRGIKTEMIENSSFFDDIVETMNTNGHYFRYKMITSVVAGKELCTDNLIQKDLRDILQSKILKFRRDEKSAPICTHDLVNPDDMIIKAIKDAGLENKEDDQVKIIFYPIYVSGADNLLKLDYYEAIQGSHFGFFPSFYEPYGYTPLESAAMQVVSLTTDTSGFGQFIMKKKDPKDAIGIHILKRMGRSTEDSAEDLGNVMFQYLKKPKEKRIECKFEARRLAEKADWKLLISEYIKAHDLAVKRA